MGQSTGVLQPLSEHTSTSEALRSLILGQNSATGAMNRADLQWVQGLSSISVSWELRQRPCLGMGHVLAEMRGP